jgi:hypothetical protein
MAKFEVLSGSTVGGTVRNHDKPLLQWSVSGPRFEPGISRMQSRNGSHSTTTFSDSSVKVNFFQIFSSYFIVTIESAHIIHNATLLLEFSSATHLASNTLCIKGCFPGSKA